MKNKKNFSHVTNSISVFLIEADPKNVRIIEELSKELSAQLIITSSDNLETAIQILKEKKFDIILLGLNFPDSNHISTFEHLINCTSHIPIIVLSDHDDEEIALSIVKAGAQDYLTKDILNSTILIRSIRYSIERFRLASELNKNELKYGKFFEEAPVGLWEEDFSEVKKYFNNLKEKGIIDIKQYFDNHPEAVIECAKKVQILNVNQVVLDIYKAKSKSLLCGNLDKFITKESLSTFKEELIILAEGRTHFNKVIENRNLEGEKIFINLHLSVSSGSEETLSSVIISTLDVTDRVKAEHALKNLKNELEESKRVYEDLYEYAPDMFVSVESKTNNIINCNKTLCNILGYSKEELLGHSIFKVYHPDSLDDAKRISIQFKETGVIKNAELKLMMKNGEKIDVSLNISPIYDENGNIIQSRSIWRDISYKKAIEEDLLVATNALESSITPIALNTMDELISYVNPAFVDKWGYDNKTEIIGRSISDFYVIDGTIKIIRDEVFSKGFWSGELQGKKKDGSLFNVLTSLSLIRNKQGKLIDIISTNIDITKQKQAEEVLAHSKEILKMEVKERTKELKNQNQLITTIIEAIPDAIIVFDSKGNLIHSNNSFREYYRRILGTKMPFVFNIYTEAVTEFLNQICELMNSKIKLLKYYDPALERHFQMNSVPIILSEGSFNSLGTVVQISDITSFVEFDNLRKKFVVITSHELRTPITAIIQSLSNITKYKDKLTEKQNKKIFSSLLRNSHLLAELIEDLLFISKLDDSKIEIIRNLFPLSDICQEVVTQLEPKSKNKNISFTIEINQQLSIFADQKKFSQIIRILCDNAIKYSHKNGEIKIYAEDKYEYGQVEGVLIRVQDSGIGIKKKNQHMIFERFYRTDEVKNISGTGLGLSIAKELVLLHNGEIFFESKFGVGSTFMIFLPQSGTD